MKGATKRRGGAARLTHRLGSPAVGRSRSPREEAALVQTPAAVEGRSPAGASQQKFPRKAAGEGRSHPPGPRWAEAAEGTRAAPVGKTSRAAPVGKKSFRPPFFSFCFLTAVLFT